MSVHAQRHLDLKLKRMGIDLPSPGLNPPRQRSVSAPVIRSGTCEEAGVPEHAKRTIDLFCEEWAKATKEPFVTLVAKNGVIVTHASFGTDPHGRPIDLDYRCWVASITKTVTSILFSQFVDQGLIELDWTLDRVFSDYPADAPYVPTFRQLLSHTSGLSGHGDWGGMFNPYLENIVLNGIDLNEPGKKHEYCGLGFELAAKAMEIKTGKCATRIYHEHLFAPLGMQDVIMGNASSDGEFTAMELAILGQWLANQGSYGEHQFITPETFAEMLPNRSNVETVAGDHGLGLHRIRHRRVNADTKDKVRCCSVKIHSDTDPFPAAFWSLIRISNSSLCNLGNDFSLQTTRTGHASSKSSPMRRKTKRRTTKVRTQRRKARNEEPSREWEGIIPFVFFPVVCILA